jgi:hypothetical protein
VLRRQNRLMKPGARPVAVTHGAVKAEEGVGARRAKGICDECDEQGNVRGLGDDDFPILIGAVRPLYAQARISSEVGFTTSAKEGPSDMLAIVAR